MIVHDFYAARSSGAVPPIEADAPLVVDPHAPLTSAVAFELFQAVSGKVGDITQAGCNIEAIQDHFSPYAKRLELFDPFAAGEAGRPILPIAQDQGMSLAPGTRDVKRNEPRRHTSN